MAYNKPNQQQAYKREVKYFKSKIISLTTVKV